MSKHLTRRNILIVVIILIVAGYYVKGSGNAGDKKVQYVTSAAGKGTLTTSISGSGNIVVDSSANIDPTIIGTVQGLAVSVGDKVKKGQVLFSIENDELDVAVARARSSVSQAEIALRNARLQKDQALLASKNGDAQNTPKKFLREENSIALDSIARAEKDLTAARLNLANEISEAAKRKVTSPIDGTVNEVNVENGDDLSKITSQSQRTVPMIIGDLSTMKALVTVNEVDIPSVSLGQKVTVTFDALPGFKATGKVEKMDSIGTLAQGVVTYNVTIGLDSIDPRVKPEMSVSAAIITDVKQDVLLVPTSAVKNEGNDSYVEIMKNGSPERKKVTLGSSNDTETEITSGISQGDKVITQTIDPDAASTASKQGNNARVPGVGRFGR